MSAPAWEPVASYWCIITHSNAAIDVDEKTARGAMDAKHVYPSQRLTLHDIYGSEFLLRAGDIMFVHENTAEQRERIRAQEDMHGAEGCDGADDDTEAWRRG